jgi:hypothetical protein
VTSDKKPEGPRERVESFAARRGEDPGDFVSTNQLEDGYVAVRFQNATYFTPLNDRSVYKEGTGYQRPILRKPVPHYSGLAGSV